MDLQDHFIGTMCLEHMRQFYLGQVVLGVVKEVKLHSNPCITPDLSF